MSQKSKRPPVRISAEHVGFRAGGAEILRDITLQIHSGEFVGLIGPNGCGKTTLLKNIYRIYRPSGGAVYLDGRDIRSMSGRAVARRLAVLAQEHKAGFDFPVMEIVLMGRYAHKKLLEGYGQGDRDICEKALALVGMSELRNRSFFSLSGGEKQRVLLAAALAQQADVMILDEPTNHLDICHQLLMMDLIRARRDTAVLASIHDINIAAGYCDRLIAMNRGKIVATGTPGEILSAALMRELFHVRAKVEREPETGRLNVLFLGAV